MSSFVGKAIIAKAKAIYGKSLKAEDYERLLKLKTVPEIAAYLKNHPHFADILRAIQTDSIHRGQLEQLIKKNAFRQTLRLIKFVQIKDSDFFRINFVKREIDILLEILRSMISESFDSQISDIPTYMKQHSSFDIFAASKAKSIADLANAVVGTPYQKILMAHEVVQNHDIDYVDIEHEFEILYYDIVFERIRKQYSGRERKDLETIYLTKIELENITKIYRLKKFYHADPDAIKKAMIHKYSRISEKKLDELIALPDPNSILQYLDKSEFQHFADQQDYVYVEYYAERIKYNLARRFMYFSNSVSKVFAAFMLLRGIETENLTNIIESIRYQLAEADIRKMLIY